MTHQCSLGVPDHLEPFDYRLMLRALTAITLHVLTDHPEPGEPRFVVRCSPDDLHVMEALIQEMLRIGRSNGEVDSEADIRSRVLFAEGPEPGERVTIDYVGWPT